MITPKQLKAARALVGWSQVDLATATGIHPVNIKNFERGTTKRPRASSLEKIRGALLNVGLVFIEEGGAGVRMLPTASRNDSPLALPSQFLAAVNNLDIAP